MTKGHSAKGGMFHRSWNTDLPPGFKTVTLPHDGRQRSYLLYVPTNYRSGRPIPLVMVFHGGGGNAYGMARKTGIDRLAEQYSFIVVYPNGTGARDWRLTWNAGSNPPEGYAEKQGIDDIGFINKALQQIKQKYSIDPRKSMRLVTPRAACSAIGLRVNYPNKLPPSLLSPAHFYTRMPTEPTSRRVPHSR